MQLRKEFLDKWYKYLEVEKWNKFGDGGFRVWGHSDMPFVASLVPIEDEKVLEIGCADGYLLYCLELSGYDVIGLTYSEGEQKECIRRGLKAIVSDMHDLPFTDNEFDAIVSRQTFEHSLSPVVVLNECNRVLKINGHMVVHIPFSETGVDYSLDYHHCSFTPVQWKYYFFKSGFKKVLREEYQPTQGSYFFILEKTEELNYAING